MSQEKVDQYKKDKYNRKHSKKKTSAKKIASYTIATLAVLFFIAYLGYSVAVSTGLYTPPATTTHIELSEEEKESARNALIQAGDPNVKTTTAAAEETTASAEKNTTSSVEETTVADK